MDVNKDFKYVCRHPFVSTDIFKNTLASIHAHFRVGNSHGRGSYTYLPYTVAQTFTSSFLFDSLALFYTQTAKAGNCSAAAHRRDESPARDPAHRRNRDNFQSQLRSSSPPCAFRQPHPPQKPGPPGLFRPDRRN